MSADVPIEGKTIRSMAFNMLKRTHYLFSNGVINSEDEEAILRERCLHVTHWSIVGVGMRVNTAWQQHLFH